MSNQKLPTIRDVAARAGVSVMTVSRVVNKQSWVSPATRAKVERAIEELNYAPNATARALAGGDDRRVALLYRSSTTSAYLGELLLGGLDEAARHHLHLVVEQCEMGASVEEVMAQIAQARVSGVIMPPPLCDWDELTEALTRQGIPAVAIAPDQGRAGLLVVAIDDRQAASDMTGHLIELGHRRIGFIQGNPQHRSSARRLEGYRQAMAAHGLPVDDDHIVEGDFSYRSGLEAAEQLLRVSATGKMMIPIVESALGLDALPAIARVPGVVRLTYGRLDLGLDLGLDVTSYGAERMFDQVRYSLLLQTRLSGLAAPLESVFSNIEDSERLQHYARTAGNMGFAGMLCIHPKQVAVVHTALAPTEEELAWARHVLDAADGRGAFRLDGEMIDAPVMARARQFLSLSAWTTPTKPDADR